MAETYGELQLTNGQTVGVAFATAAAVPVRLKLQPGGGALATSNAMYFMVKSPCKIADFQSQNVASGILEIDSDGRPTGKFIDLRKTAIASAVKRVFPSVTFIPGRKYSLRVVQDLVDG